MLKQHTYQFLGIIIIGSILLAVLAYFSLAPLNDTTTANPAFASQESLKYSNYFNKTTLLIYAILIFSSNLIYKNTQKAVYLFWGWLFFTAAMLFSYVYVAEVHFHFKQKTGLWQGEFSLAGFAGIALSVVAAIAASINYLVLKSVVKKKYNEKG